MSKIPNKYTIKIPKYITVIYCKEKNILILSGALKKKSLNLRVMLEVIEMERLIRVTEMPVFKTSNAEKKKIKSLQGTTVALINQAIIETSIVLYKKLNFVGVGYRAFDTEHFEKELLMFKLGYSHPIYFKTPKNIGIVCLKRTKLFLFGNSYQNITQIASTIRSYKSPEPYKGKGILYQNEKIKLKEGKKV